MNTKHKTAGMSRDTCCTQGHNKRSILYLKLHFYLFWLVTGLQYIARKYETISNRTVLHPFEIIEEIIIYK